MVGIDMGLYYKLRKKIRELYNGSLCNSNELCATLLEVKDKNKCVISMNIDLSSNYIEFQFDEETNFDKVKKITDTVLKRITSFISSNRNILDMSSEEQKIFDIMIEGTGHDLLFCFDCIIVGHGVKINL